MTRPHIVRADTLDLQDQENPTAAEHHKPVINGGLAAHQRAEIHHIREERDSEEHALQDAWNMAGDLTEEPDALDHAQEQHGTADPTTNGTHQDGEDGTEDGEGDGDDDMMDRISSSPSIDDGGYSQHSTSLRHNLAIDRVKWPPRTSSLSPSPRNTPTPTRERTFNQSSSPLSFSTPDSSPFVQTPRHLPLHVRRTGRAASPLIDESIQSPSQLPREG